MKKHLKSPWTSRSYPSHKDPQTSHPVRTTVVGLDTGAGSVGSPSSFVFHISLSSTTVSGWRRIWRFGRYWVLSYTGSLFPRLTVSTISTLDCPRVLSFSFHLRTGRLYTVYRDDTSEPLCRYGLLISLRYCPFCFCVLYDRCMLYTPTPVLTPVLLVGWFRPTCLPSFQFGPL